MSHPIAFIDLQAQQRRIKAELDSAIACVLTHGQFILGPEVAELEERLAQYAGVHHAIGCSSGTDALLVALMALGVGYQDEVITTPFGFMATAEVIVLLGAQPVFVDIDPKTYHLNPDLIEAAITPRTKAIMPVSLYGQCADFDAINAIADRHEIPVIEDAAQSFGATYKGRSSCSLSSIGCTSFFPSKPLGCYGDGGACFTDEDELAKSMRAIRDHGQESPHHHARIGINGRMDTLQAAVVLAKLHCFPEEVELRAQIGNRYTGLLSGTACVTPFIEPHNTSVYAQYTIQVDARDHVRARLKESGIPTAVYYPTLLNRQPAVNGLGRAADELRVAQDVAARVLSLPMHPYLEDEDLARISTALASVLSVSS